MVLYMGRYEGSFQNGKASVFAKDFVFFLPILYIFHTHTHTQWKNSLVKDAVIMKITVSRIITISSLVSSIVPWLAS